MPCSSEHMEPLRDEVLSKETASHLEYLIDTGYLQCAKAEAAKIREAADHYYGNPGALDRWVSQLCKVLEEMPEAVKDTVVYEGRSKRARRLADWWDRHQRADKVREQKEND